MFRGKIIKFIGVLLFLIAPTVVFALNCSVCNKSIKGQYIQANGKSFCSERCFEKTLPTCDTCGKVIKANFIKSGNNNYCSQACFNNTLAKCSYCKKPCTQGTITFLNNIYCSKSCIDKVHHCHICRGSLEKSQSVTTPNDETFIICSNCLNQPSCFYCFLPYPTKKLSDGRHICASCDKKAIKSITEIQELFQKIRNTLAQDFGYDNEHKIYLRVVDFTALKEAASGSYSPSTGQQLALMQYNAEYTTETSIKGEKKEYISFESCKIFVLTNTPEDQLISALVHELTHDYLRHNVGEVKDLASEEGFCELVAVLFNQKYGYEYLNKAKFINPDPIYGDGFRKMLKLYKKTNSFKETLKYLGTPKNL